MTVLNTGIDRNLGTLALACLAHLEQEEAMLGSTLDSLRQVRTALMSGDLSALDRALGMQQHTARAADELRSRRASLRATIGSCLGLDPRTVTLRDVAARLGPAEQLRLLKFRERLHDMSLEIDRLNRGNAALVQHSVEFLHKFLLGLTGGEAVGDRYRPSGEIERATCGSLFEGRA